MSLKHVGTQSIVLPNPPSIAASACVVGKKEGDGPLASSFDYISNDSFFGEKTWEKAESLMVKKALSTALGKATIPPSAVELVYAGDLLNQCVGTSFGLRELGIPFLGVYGACSTMAESLALAAMTIDGGFADCTAAVTSSHFCTAERQYRFPLEYGGQRTPTAQWTVTGSGAVVLTDKGPGPYVTRVTWGKIADMGVTDANNMGAAMAPAAYETLSAHFQDFGETPNNYDLIVTGDLGLVGSEILKELFKRDGVEISHVYNDCGLMIFSLKTQDVHAGGSGCGCSAVVLTGHILDGMRSGKWNKVLFAATGALLSPTTTQQGESIPGVCHAVTLSTTK